MKYNISTNNDTLQIDPGKNWGDIISYHIIRYFSNNDKLKPEHVFWFDPDAKQVFKNGKILAIGSIMKFCKPNDVVWGTGVIDEVSIGDNPKKTIHSKILTTNDPFIPFDQLNIELSNLKSLIDKNKSEEVKKNGIFFLY